MKNQSNIKSNSALESALFARGRRRVAAPANANDATESELDNIVAFVEGRMTPAQARTFRKRLTASPALQDAMGDYVIALRGTEAGRAWLETGAARALPAAAKGQRLAGAGLRPFLRSVLRPWIALPALGAAAAVFFVVWMSGRAPDRTAAPAPHTRYASIIAELDNKARQGELTSARVGFRRILEEHGVPEAERIAAQQRFEELTRAEYDRHARRHEFDQAAAIAEEALRVVPENPDLLIDAADARLLALRQQVPTGAASIGTDPFPLPPGYRPPSGYAARTPAPAADPAQRQELDRILGYYQRAAQVSPGNVKALLGQSEILIYRGDFAAANQALGQARTVAPNDPDVQSALGRLFQSKGRDDLAREAFEKALQQPARPAARYDLNSLFEKN